MADALVERRPTARFFCHRCNIEFEDVLQVKINNFSYFSYYGISGEVLTTFTLRISPARCSASNLHRLIRRDYISVANFH